MHWQTDSELKTQKPTGKNEIRGSSEKIKTFIVSLAFFSMLKMQLIFEKSKRENFLWLKKVPTCLS